MRSRVWIVVAVLAMFSTRAHADGPGPDARAACVAAMNADKAFATDVVMNATKQADPAVLRQTCDVAIGLDATFAAGLAEHAADLESANRRLAADTKQHETASEAIAKNERHVIIAYAAMWLVAVGFLLFLRQRQLGLRREIALLRRDLEAALKENA